jgi:hypothetical protein
LLTLHQGKEEEEECHLLEVDSPDDKTMLNALMQGIRVEGPLMADLAKSAQEVTLAPFMKKTKEFINQEELVGTLLKA